MRAELLDEGGKADRRTLQVLLWVLLGLFVVLLATGVHQYFEYRPTGAQAFGLDLVNDGEGVGRVVHRLAAFAFGLDALAVAGLSIAVSVRRLMSRSLPRAWLFGAALVLLAIALGVTGYPLAWDQLALESATVGSRVAGIDAVFGDDVSFVLTDGGEVSKGTYRSMVVAHALVLPPLALGSAAGLLLMLRTKLRASVPDDKLPAG